MGLPFRSGAACAAMVAAGGLLLISPPSPAQAQGSSATKARTGFCRSAEALPILAPEPIPSQEPRRDRDRRDFAEESSPAPMPPPSPTPMSTSKPSPRTMERAPSSARADVAEAVVSDVPMTATASPRGEAPAAAGHDARIRPPLPPVPPMPPRYEPPPQSGQLTAGEHDDILNPELYAAYVSRSDLGQRIPDLPRVDTRRMLTVDVKDRSGKAVPFADVKITCSDGNSLTLATHSDGRATFFTALDYLSPRITVEALKNGRSIHAPQSLALTDRDGGQAVTLTTKQGASGAAKALDLMLVIDTTGSMGDEIRYLQAELTSIVQGLKERHRNLDVRVGFVFYRDEGDNYVTRTVAFDQDISAASDVLARQSASGGGDYPEAMDQAMIRAVGQVWRPNAVKSLVLVADAPPHDDKYGRTWLAAEAARAKRIQITPVAASGVADEAEYVMRAMAALTGSRYLFLTDDSGIGNPHAPPAVACYVVTRLDAALRRVLDSQISGQRIEPSKGEVIRTVGQYNKGKCALPDNFRWQ